jgi:hypothetical protein
MKERISMMTGTERKTDPAVIPAAALRDIDALSLDGYLVGDLVWPVDFAIA